MGNCAGSSKRVGVASAHGGDTGGKPGRTSSSLARSAQAAADAAGHSFRPSNTEAAGGEVAWTQAMAKRFSTFAQLPTTKGEEKKAIRAHPSLNQLYWEVGGYRLFHRLSDVTSKSSSEVRMAVHVESGRVCAAKVLQRNRLRRGGRGGTAKRKGAAKGVRQLGLSPQGAVELEVYSRLDHPHIITKLDAVDDPDKRRVLLITEIMCWSLAAARPFYLEAVAKRLIYQLLDALAFVHDHDIVHRDIKPANCLVSEDLAILKLGDFGSAAFLQDGHDRVDSSVGTPAFFSPEVWVHHASTPSASRREDWANLEACYLGGFAAKPADVWAVGVTMFMLVVGHHPFWRPDQTPAQLRETVCEAKLDFTPQPVVYDDDDATPGMTHAQSVFEQGAKSVGDFLAHHDSQRVIVGTPIACSPEGQRFIRDILNPDPAARPTAAELMAHPYLAGVTGPREKATPRDDHEATWVVEHENDLTPRHWHHARAGGGTAASASGAAATPTRSLSPHEAKRSPHPIPTPGRDGGRGGVSAALASPSAVAMRGRDGRDGATGGAAREHGHDRGAVGSAAAADAGDHNLTRVSL